MSQRLKLGLPHKLVLGFLALAALAVAVPARADDDSSDNESNDHRRRDRDHSRTHIAMDFDFGSALDAPHTKAGGGGALRLGQEFDLLLVTLIPEFGGGYHAFGGDDETKIYNGFLGGRLAVGKIIEPSIFGHVGVAHVSGMEMSRTAPMMDAGLALDFTLLPLIDLGVHAGYNVMLPTNDNSALKFVTLGAQAALVL